MVSRRFKDSSTVFLVPILGTAVAATVTLLAAFAEAVTKSINNSYSTARSPGGLCKTLIIPSRGLVRGHWFRKLATRRMK